jgi:hypothetical protein
MKKKGSLGVATLLMQVHNVIDVVKVTLPPAGIAKQLQAADDWGERWVRYLIPDTDRNYNSTLFLFRWRNYG